MKLNKRQIGYTKIGGTVKPLPKFENEVFLKCSEKTTFFFKDDLHILHVFTGQGLRQIAWFDILSLYIFCTLFISFIYLG